MKLRNTSNLQQSGGAEVSNAGNYTWVGWGVLVGLGCGLLTWSFSSFLLYFETCCSMYYLSTIFFLALLFSLICYWYLNIHSSLSLLTQPAHGAILTKHLPTYKASSKTYDQIAKLATAQDRTMKTHRTNAANWTQSIPTSSCVAFSPCEFTLLFDPSLTSYTHSCTRHSNYSPSFRSQSFSIKISIWRNFARLTSPRLWSSHRAPLKVFTHNWSKSS